MGLFINLYIHLYKECHWKIDILVHCMCFLKQQIFKTIHKWYMYLFLYGLLTNYIVDQMPYMYVYII